MNKLIDGQIRVSVTIICLLNSLSNFGYGSIYILDCLVQQLVFGGCKNKTDRHTFKSNARHYTHYTPSINNNQSNIRTYTYTQHIILIPSTYLFTIVENTKSCAVKLNQGMLMLYVLFFLLSVQLCVPFVFQLLLLLLLQLLSLLFLAVNVGLRQIRPLCGGPVVRPNLFLYFFAVHFGGCAFDNTTTM